jgi:hypothetical protein
MLARLEGDILAARVPASRTVVAGIDDIDPRMRLAVVLERLIRTDTGQDGEEN